MDSGSKLYLIGSLRNKRIPELAKKLRKEHPDVEVFDDWFAAGEDADDVWKEYEQDRGRSYQAALRGYSAKHVFDYDRSHLDSSSHTLLVLPAGKSGHMEVMYAQYKVGAKCAILLDPSDVRWDVMYQFIPTILNNDEEIKDWLKPTPTVSRLVPPDRSLIQESPRSSKASCITSRELSKQLQASQNLARRSIFGMDGAQYQTEFDVTPKP